MGEHATSKRFKTNYPGVYFLEGKATGHKGQKKYTTFDTNGKEKSLKKKQVVNFKTTCHRQGFQYPVKQKNLFSLQVYGKVKCSIQWNILIFIRFLFSFDNRKAGKIIESIPAHESEYRDIVMQQASNEVRSILDDALNFECESKAVAIR